MQTKPSSENYLLNMANFAIRRNKLRAEEHHMNLIQKSIDKIELKAQKNNIPHEKLELAIQRILQSNSF